MKDFLKLLGVTLLYSVPLMIWLEPPWYASFSIGGLVASLMTILDRVDP